MRLKIALRNIFRNSRRTALNLFMIASGVASIVLFKGYSSRLLSDIREDSIRTEYGHLQIAPQVFWDNTLQSPKEGLIPDYARLTEELRKIPGVESVAGRLGFYGLLAYQERTQATRGITLDLATEAQRAQKLDVPSGERLREDAPDSILVGTGVAAALGLRPGADVTLLGYTYDGVINAMDARVSGLLLTGMAEIDNITYMIPLKTAQKLLDTESVERVVVHLDRTESTETLLPIVERIAKAASPGLSVRTWRQLNKLYYEVEQFYQVYNTVIQTIILALVLVGILNTVGMSIFERTGEIGTLRALGDTDASLVRQFTLEGLVLGLLGGALGVLAGFALAALLNWMKIPIILPGATVPLPILIEIRPSIVAEAILLTVGTATLASFIPAVRATRIEIVDALRRNI